MWTLKITWLTILIVCTFSLCFTYMNAFTPSLSYKNVGVIGAKSPLNSKQRRIPYNSHTRIRVSTNDNTNIDGDENNAKFTSSNTTAPVTIAGVTLTTKPSPTSATKSKSTKTEASVLPTPPQQKPFSSDRPHFEIAENEIVGIGGVGGKKGHVYDINKLKKNLVQKSVRQFKKELLLLLIGNNVSPIKARDDNDTSNIRKTNNVNLRSAAKSYAYMDDDNKSGSDVGKKEKEKEKNRRRQKARELLARRRLNIEEKIASLVSANPVQTTTDSNLLEGTWELAFSTDNAVEILNEARFVYNRRPTRISNERGGYEFPRREKGKANKIWRLDSGKRMEHGQHPLHMKSRTICLEELEDEEDPFVFDTVKYWGLVEVNVLYRIVGLTRTSLQLEPCSKSIFVCGKEIRAKMADPAEYIPLDLQFIYLDSDIVITMIGGDEDTLQVFTKNEVYIDSRSQKKYMKDAALSLLFKNESPLKLRRKLTALFGYEYVGGEDTPEMGKLTEEEYEILLRRVYDDKESKLMALRLGDYGDTDDESSAWQGKDDPFVHLTADERQDIMKQMTVEEIRKAGYIHQRIARKQKKRGSKRQNFIRPSFDE